MSNMLRNNLKNQLFDAHNADLREIFPHAEGFILCPICLNPFYRNEIENKRLTDGHVWSETFIRKYTSSKKALQFRVLICDRCNSRSGYQNEASLIKFEKYQKAHDDGQFYRPRVIVKEPSKIEPLDLGRIDVRELGDNNVTFSFPRNKKTGQPAHDPSKREEFFKMVARGSYTFIVKEEFQRRKNWFHSRVSLLTSAYLMAFRSFGYRFVLKKCYEPLRSLILRSFLNEIEDESAFEELNEYYVRTCETHFYEEPLLLIFPEKHNDKQHIEVRFLKFHIAMPCPLPHELLFNSPKWENFALNYTDHIPQRERSLLGYIFRNPDFEIVLPESAPSPPTTPPQT